MDLGSGVVVLETDGVTLIQTRPVASSWDSVSIRLQGQCHSIFRCLVAQILITAGIALLGYVPMVKIIRE